MSGADPILEACARTYPVRPVLDAADWPYTQTGLDVLVDFWMGQLAALERLGRALCPASADVLSDGGKDLTMHCTQTRGHEGRHTDGAYGWWEDTP